MEQFKSFIAEAEDEKYRIVVISAEKGDKAITAKRMEEEANKLKYPIYVAGMDGTYTKFENGVRTVHKSDDDKAIAAIQMIMKIPGLNIAKAGFAVQLTLGF